MRLINFGGATALLEHRGTRILFDPWLDDGIFHGAWIHFPPLQVGIEDVGRLDYIYISHIHEDHCSAGTLARLDKNATLLIMDRQPNFVLDFLKRHDFGFKAIRCLPPHTPTELEPGLWADMLEPDPADAMAAMIDSALLLRWDDVLIFNANDCQPHPAMLDYLARQYGPPDLALLPYSGGSGYPACYTNLGEEEKEAECERIRRMRLASFIDTARRTGARRIMPFADQYAIAGSRAALNRHVSHPPGPDAVVPACRDAGLLARLVLLQSGQAYDLETDRQDPPGDYPATTQAMRQEAVAAFPTCYDHEKISFGPSVPLARLVAMARARLWEKQVRLNRFPAIHLILEAPEEAVRFKLSLDCSEVHPLPADAGLPEPRLLVRCNRTLLIMMLIGHVSWNIADAALFLDYERVPNVYDPDLYMLLNFLKI